MYYIDIDERSVKRFIKFHLKRKIKKFSDFLVKKKKSVKIQKSKKIGKKIKIT